MNNDDFIDVRILYLCVYRMGNQIYQGYVPLALRNIQTESYGIILYFPTETNKISPFVIELYEPMLRNISIHVKVGPK